MSNCFGVAAVQPKECLPSANTRDDVSFITYNVSFFLSSYIRAKRRSRRNNPIDHNFLKTHSNRKNFEKNYIFNQIHPRARAHTASL